METLSVVALVLVALVTIIMCFILANDRRNTSQLKDMKDRLESLETMYLAISDDRPSHDRLLYPGQIITMPTKEVVAAILNYLGVKPQKTYPSFKLVKDKKE